VSRRWWRALWVLLMLLAFALAGSSDVRLW
jgi:hypothetical protein